jgi:hypothetical protein
MALANKNCHTVRHLLNWVTASMVNGAGVVELAVLPGRRST